MVFYVIMVFIIYDHHVTDYLQIMILSCVINLILVTLIWGKKSTRTPTNNGFVNALLCTMHNPWRGYYKLKDFPTNLVK